MILLVHMLFGAAIGASIYNISLAIILAFLGHYFLDIFPHIEYLKSTENSIKNLKTGGLKKNTKDITKVLLDFFLGILTIFILSNNQLIIYICAFIALIPDGLTVISNLLPNKILDLHDKFHKKIHYLTKQKKFPIFWRITTQAIAVIISILLLI